MILEHQCCKDLEKWLLICVWPCFLSLERVLYLRNLPADHLWNHNCYTCFSEPMVTVMHLAKVQIQSSASKLNKHSHKHISAFLSFFRCAK